MEPRKQLSYRLERVNRRGEQDEGDASVLPHRATPPPPLRVDGLLKLIGKKPTRESATPAPTDMGSLFL